LRSFFFKLGLSLVALSFLLAGFDEGYFAYAQSVVFPSTADQSRERVPTPITQPSGAPFNFRLQSPERSPIPRAIDSLKFTLGGIRVEGSSIYEAEDLRSIYAHLIGQTVVLEDVRQIAEKIEEKYKSQGYFLTRVFLPPQQVKDGVFQIRVIEGYIGDIQIEGATQEIRQDIQQRLSKLLNRKPIDLPSVERALLLLNDLPGVQGAGLLRAGRELGATDLLVQLTVLPATGLITLSNHSSRSIGPVIVNFATQFRSILQDQDELTVQFGASGDGKELVNANWRYAFLIGQDGLMASFGSLKSRARPGNEFTELNLESRVLSRMARLRYPLIRSRDGSVYAEVGTTNVSAQTFKDEARLIEEKHTTREASLQVVEARSVLGVTQASVGFSRANSIHAPSPSVANHDPDLKKYTYNFKHQLPIAGGLSAQLEIQGQYATKPLLSSERIAFGGAGIGRGFTPSTIVGDRGIGGSFELGWSERFTTPWETEGVGQFFVFRDYARTQHIGVGGAQDLDYKLRSSGVGFRWQANDGFRSSVYIAKPQPTDGITNPNKERVYFTVAIPW
jgi:hemolysin activation/secretion protein